MDVLAIAYPCRAESLKNEPSLYRFAILAQRSGPTVVNEDRVQLLTHPSFMRSPRGRATVACRSASLRREKDPLQDDAGRMTRARMLMYHLNEKRSGDGTYSRSHQGKPRELLELI